MIERDEIVVAGLTHQGMVRKDNQDSYGFIEPETEEQLASRGRLFIVADGLGGHRGGRVASNMAVDIIGKLYFSSEQEPVYPAFLHAVEVANRSIFEASNKHEDLRGMATTCTALVILGQDLYMSHVGDSRAYLVRNGTIKQISTDHTLVEEMVHSGIINEDEAKSHPDSHILTRSLGILQAVEMDILDPPLKMQPGDTFLMCSDGLTAYLEDNEILHFAANHTPDKACELLIETANERGGRDNITVEIVHIKQAHENMQAALEDTQPLIRHAETVLGPGSLFHGPLDEVAATEWSWSILFYALYATLVLGYYFWFYQ